MNKMNEERENSEDNNISIKDVAREAEVSPTTVSRVINNSKHPVNEKTKEIVKKTIKKLNYQPNRLAQGLKKNKSNIIGVIVHDISDEYFAQMVKGIETVTFDNDYIVNIINTERDIHKELKAVNMLKANRAEAVILTGGNLINDEYHKKMKNHIKDLKSQNTYILGVTSHPYEIKNIRIGNRKAAEIITQYMIDKGYKNIAYINGPPILSTTRERLKGYKYTLGKAEIKVRKEYIIPGDFTFEGGRKAADKLEKLFNDDNKIEAVVASNDEAALGLIWELKQKGINIPQEIAVGGIGDIPAAKYSEPGLTTISLPLYELGQKIGKNVVNYLNNNLDEMETLEVNIGLVERKST